MVNRENVILNMRNLAHMGKGKGGEKKWDGTLVEQICEDKAASAALCNHCSDSGCHTFCTGIFFFAPVFFFALENTNHSDCLQNTLLILFHLDEHFKTWEYAKSLLESHALNCEPPHIFHNKECFGTAFLH